MEIIQALFSDLWSILLVIVFFGGSIFVHELGHFYAARRRGLVVERFSIGFGPKLFGWRGKDGVEYRLSWLPLGGYVALPQLADMRGIEGESSVDVKQLPPISYTTKMIVFGAGAFCNVVFAFFLATIIWVVGQPTIAAFNTTRIGDVLPTVKLTDGTVVTSPAVEAGLRPGDIIRAVDGKSVEDWTGLLQTLAAGTGRTADNRPEARLTIERDGVEQDVIVHPRLAGEEGFRSLGIEESNDLTVEKLIAGGAAEQAGVKSGDMIVAANGTTIKQRSALSELIQKAGATPVALTINRAGETVQMSVTPRAETTDDGKTIFRIGIQYRDPLVILYPTPLKQISGHVTMTFRILSGLLSFKSDLGPSKLSGPVGIVRGFHSFAQADIRLVLWFTILVNVNLAIFNLLPIPVLDGGHMAFATISKLRGRSLPANFIAATQSVFMVILFTMIIYVSFFDVRRWARDSRNDRVENTTTGQPPAATTPTPAPAPAQP